MNANDIRPLLWTAAFLVFAAMLLPAQQSPRYLVYVTNENSGDVSVIDPASQQEIARIPVGKRPRGIHASPDGNTIYVALSGSPPAPPGVDESKLPPPDRSADGIGVIDRRTRKLVRIIRSGTDPEDFSLSRDGKLLFVSNEDASQVSVVDIESGKIQHTMKVGGEPEGVTTSPDGRFVYVASEETGTVAVIDTAQMKVIRTIEVGRRPRMIAFLPDGSRAYVSAENDGTVTVLDARRHRRTGSIRLGAAGVIKPMGVVVSPDGRTVYVSAGRGKKAFAIDAQTNRVSASWEVGTRPWGIGLSPDGKHLYTANGPSDDVSVVGLTSGQMTKIPAGRSPWGVLVLPAD